MRGCHSMYSSTSLIFMANLERRDGFQITPPAKVRLSRICVISVKPTFLSHFQPTTEP